MTRAHRPALRRETYELAVVTSALALALTYALHRFVGVSEMPLVLGTLVIASIVGWTQPALRAAPRRTGRMTPVVVNRRAAGAFGAPDGAPTPSSSATVGHHPHRRP